MGKSGIGLRLGGGDVGLVEPGQLQRGGHRRAADAVERGVDDLQLARATSGEVDDGAQVAVQDLVADDLDVRLLCRSRLGTRDVGDRAHRGDLLGDLRVGRRDDLAAVAEVDLVAVVLWRVVARGHHHPRDAAEVTDGEGEHGGGQRPGEDVRLEPGTDHHLGGVAGEDVGVVAGVVPDHDGVVPSSAVEAGRGPVVDEVRRQPGRSAHHHHPVHPVGACAERTAQTGRAELERAVEAVGELVRGALLDQRSRARRWSPDPGPRPPRRMARSSRSSGIAEEWSLMDPRLVPDLGFPRGRPGHDQQPGEVVREPQALPETDVVAVGLHDQQQ